MTIPRIAQDAAERIRRGDKDGASWVYFHGATRQELRDLEAYLVEIRHPLAYQAGSQWNRFSSYVHEIAAA